MNKKMSLINLSMNEIDKKDMSKVEAGISIGGAKGHYRNDNQLNSMAAMCGAWCFCRCPGIGVNMYMDSTGNFNAGMNAVMR